MPRVIHFEIHCDDLDRAARFYSELLGWSFHKWEGPGDYRLITTGPDAQPGINGGLLRRMGRAPAGGEPVASFVCTVDVESVDDAVSRVGQLGGSIAHPKMPVPGVGWLAYAKDTEGNIFGMMQNDPSAR